MQPDDIRILVVDDEPRYTRIIQINLEASGYQVLVAQNAQQAIEIAAAEALDLILLDLMLPGPEGFSVCQRIREFSDVPIIMLTALTETPDVIRGLDAGADDYITKPFSAQELLARVRAILRRTHSVAVGRETVYTCGDVSVDAVARRAYVNGEEVELSSTEYTLLLELVRNAGRVLVPEYLMERIWGDASVGSTNLLWQAIHRLRAKVEPDPRRPRYIRTRHGIGYIFTPDEED